MVAAFSDPESCSQYEHLHWSKCDPAEARAGRLRCELMTDLGAFEGKTRCTQGVLRWEDVADGGRWGF